MQSSVPDAEPWHGIPERFRAGEKLAAPWEEMFGPLRGSADAETVAVGQIGQSLDGRIATPAGHSHYINGEAGLAHLHRLRALVDAVVVGAGTVQTDDPQLTVRRVEGPNPARVVIDPHGRIPASARVFADDGIRRIVLTAQGTVPALSPGIEVVALPVTDGALQPAAMLAALAARGLRRVLVEGGANTVSRLLAAGCLDRLHVVVAPMILGAGPSGLSLPPVLRADQAMRMPVHIHRLGAEVLFDCDLAAHRAEAGRANRST